MKIASEKDIKGVLSVLKRKGYKIFERPYELNIVGMRTSSMPNSFDDKIHVFWKEKDGKWKGYIFPATTDAGTYWLKNPMQVDGTAILKEGQYVNAYQIGLHQNSYSALTQKGKVTILRDYDRDAIFDFNTVKQESGYYGINIHRATASGSSKTVDKWSAGCQVLQNSGDFDTLMDLAEKHKNLYGNSFTYTLIDERAFIRTLKRRSIYTIGGISLIAFAIMYYYRKQADKLLNL